MAKAGKKNTTAPERVEESEDGVGRALDRALTIAMAKANEENATRVEVPLELTPEEARFLRARKEQMAKARDAIERAIAIRDGLIAPPWMNKAPPASASTTFTKMTDDFVTARDWITAEARRMKTAGEIDESIRITHFAKILAATMRKAIQAAAPDESRLRSVGSGTIKNRLRGWGLWPISAIK
jgi:hypothetical protein